MDGKSIAARGSVIHGLGPQAIANQLRNTRVEREAALQ
jgi:hypothetical protein